MLRWLACLMAASMPAKLVADVLVHLERPDLSATTRKRLQWIAARVIASGADCPNDGQANMEQEPRWLLESVLAEAKLELSTGKRLSVVDVKGHLRRAGQAGLAARVSKLSKSRNSCSHPDVALPAEVRAALKALPPSLGSAGHEPADDSSLGRGSASEEFDESLAAGALESQVPSPGSSVDEYPGVLYFHLDQGDTWSRDVGVQVSILRPRAKATHRSRG